jgi:hypothetical protein
MIRTIQLCIHCRHNNAEFWVSGTTDAVVRRPWCPSCCQALDRSQYCVTPNAEEGDGR